MISQFFIDRPVFAWVLAIVLMLAGALSVFRLPVMQYPSIAPPQVSIGITYPGASAQTVQDTVVQVIEQQLNGIDNLDYLTSDSNADGSAQITLTFEQSTNADIAQVQVQNKLQLAMPLLPQEVQQQGVRVAKPTRNFLVVLGFISANDSMSSEDIGDYVATNVLDQLNRTPGVGDVQMFGSQYAMRVWLDPEKLNNFGLTSTDIAAAIRAQNAQVSAGQIGGLPAVAGQQVTAAIIGPTRLSTPDEFRQILVRVNPDGSQLRLGDVTRVSMNSENYVRDIKIDGKPAAGMAIRLAVGANALDTVNAIDATLKRLEPFFPAGLQPTFPLDTTPFVRASIEEVVFTLLEAIGLVFLVIFAFLQNLRATLIPTIAVPIVLLGTFGVLAAFGFSINTLTMFGVALSIGLLVDDAIVVVENVERLMVQEDLSPKEATRKSMRQITGALIGIALVLAAVFVPMAFFGGSAGVIYRQFSITMVSAMTLSVLTALILTPALCATMLKPIPPGGPHARGGFFGWFNRAFGASARGYDAAVAGGLKRPVRMLVVYGGLVAAMTLLYLRLPTSFFPDEDTGILYGQVQAPPGASQERTWQSLDAMQNYFLGKESDSIDEILTVVGFNFAGTGQNSGLAFIKLKDWSQRTKASQAVSAVAARATRYFATIRDAMVLAFAPPPVMELGNATGFDMQLQNRGGLTHEAFLAARNQLLAEAARNPALVAVRPNGVEDAPQIKLEIDREKASALGVSIADINQTITAAWAPSYVNDFIDHGRVKRVYLQGEAYARMQPEDLTQWYVRNAHGGMVPLSAFATAKWTYGPQKLSRFNGVPSYEILGSPAPGRSSGEAMTHHGRSRRETAEWRRPRMDGSVVRGKARRCARSDPVCVVARGRVSVPRGALRELVDSGHGAARGADRRARRVARDFAARPVERRVLPGRPAHDDRPRREERRADRRVREGELRSRQEPAGRGRQRGTAAVPADRHDFAGVHVRRAPARARDRCGFGRAECRRHRRGRRHAGIDAARHRVRARVLRRDPQAVQGAADEARLAGPDGHSTRHRRALSSVTRWAPRSPPW